MFFISSMKTIRRGNFTQKVLHNTPAQIRLPAHPRSRPVTPPSPSLLIRPQDRPVTGFLHNEDILMDGEGAVYAFVGLGDGYLVDVVEDGGVLRHLPSFEFLCIINSVFERIGPEMTEKYMVALLDVVRFFKPFLHLGME